MPWLCEQLFLFISLSHVYLVLYHITFNFHHTWNNRKELFPAHSTTETRGTMLTKTDSVKKTSILITTQQITEQDYALGIYNMKNYLCFERYAWFWATCIADRIFQFLFDFFKTISLTNKWHLLSLYCNPIQIISWLVQNIYFILMRQRIYAVVPLKAFLTNLACIWMFDTDEDVW